MFNPEDEDLPHHFDESIYKPEDKPEESLVLKKKSESFLKD